jgi:cytochrome P450
MTAVGTPHYLLDQARRRFTPTLNTIPGMGAIEKLLLAHEWKTKLLAQPPAGTGLKPVLGPSGLPMLGHAIELFRMGPDYPLFLYRTEGPVVFVDSPFLASTINVLGPDATQLVLSNKNKDFSQQAWNPIIGSFFNRGLVLLDFEEHRYHRRIMQDAFTRTRLAGYVEQIDRVASAVVAEWPNNDARFLFHPAMKELSLDIASTAFMGHEPGTDHALVTKVNRAFTTTTRACAALIRHPVPPFKWWRGVRARKVLEDYFIDRVRARRNTIGADMLTVLCHAEDEDGNRFTDADIVNHMIFLMTAAHDTATSTAATMAYHLAAHPEWQERARDESARLGDGPLDIESLEKLETLDLVMNESLRLVTPLPLTMRRAVRDTELLDYYIPAGTNLIVWTSMNHRLSELWTDPYKFDPERFAEPRAEHKRHRYAFSPFGGGAHKCIGMVFARLEVKAVMHRLLQTYRLEPARQGYEPTWDNAGMPIPMDGMPIVLRPL